LRRGWDAVLNDHQPQAPGTGPAGPPHQHDREHRHEGQRRDHVEPAPNIGATTSSRPAHRWPRGGGVAGKDGSLTIMELLVWVAEGTWPAVVDAAAATAGPDDRVTLLHVADAAVAGALHGAFAGLVGRGHHRDPGAAVEAAEQEAGRSLLAAAAQRLGRPAETVARRGRVEREVVAAAVGVDLLVVARDGLLDRLGPRSLAPATRFVVDHAPCAVLLVWPQPPSETRLPPPPEHLEHPGPPPGPPPPPGHRPPHHG
jgi:Universal stress protein family